MEHQLNNPLRPSVKPLRTESPAPESSSSGKTAKEAKLSQPLMPEQPYRAPAQVQHSVPTEKSSSHLKPEVRKALDALNVSEELRKLMLQLTENGIEIAGPKKTYIKHSYEIDQEFHQRFHEMYPVLGFKKVKDAINDAIATWCDQNEEEFRRRSGSKK